MYEVYRFRDDFFDLIKIGSNIIRVRLQGIRHNDFQFKETFVGIVNFFVGYHLFPRLC